MADGNHNIHITLQSYHNHQIILRCFKLSWETASPFKINLIYTYYCGKLYVTTCFDHECTNWFLQIRTDQNPAELYVADNRRQPHKDFQHMQTGYKLIRIGAQVIFSKREDLTQTKIQNSKYITLNTCFTKHHKFLTLICGVCSKQNLRQIGIT